MYQFRIRKKTATRLDPHEILWICYWCHLVSAIKGFGTERARLGILKMSKNCRLFTQKEHIPAQEKTKFCTKKITSCLLWFCKTNPRPLLKKNTFLRPKKEVLHEKLKTILPAVILKKKFLTPNFTKFLNP